MEVRFGVLASERHREILEELRRNKSVKVSQLVERFNVSIETIRRDLEYLEKEGLLKRVHGGAVLDEVNSRELSYLDRETKNIDEKREIAERAIRFVTEGQSIALDVSTTNTEFAKALKNHFNRLTIITNSLPITLELAEKPHFTVILIGGVLRNEELCTVGDMAAQFLSQFRIDTFFMSMSGISLSEGLTDYGIGEVQIKKKMMEISQRKIVLADSSKFDVVSLLKVCDFEQIDHIITDSKVNEKIVEKYINRGIEIIYK